LALSSGVSEPLGPTPLLALILCHETLASGFRLGIVRACNRHPAGWSFGSGQNVAGSAGLTGITGAERA